MALDFSYLILTVNLNILFINKPILLHEFLKMFLHVS